MSKPQKEPTKESYYRDVYFLFEIISSLDNIEDIKNFFKDALTTSELRMIKGRWYIARLLNQGLNVREVARQAEVSTQTVMRIKKILAEGAGGLKKALDATSIKEEVEDTTEDNNITKYSFG